MSQNKKLYISEKPSVAHEFAKSLKLPTRKFDGYMESEEAVITWCVGHLVTMSYPEKYDASLKKWSMETLPFIPKKFKYEVIPNVKKQFNVVKGLLTRKDIGTIYICTDSGREGEYIYRLVDQLAKVPKTTEKRRVWIDSQTEEEILRGIKEAKLLSDYDNLSSAAYLRAKEDYLMGINFSRVLTLNYGNTIHTFLKNNKWSAIAVGRVMTCVLGMVVRREREIRVFVKTPFFRVIGTFETEDKGYQGEWKAVDGSAYYQTPYLYKENGLKEKETAIKMIEELAGTIMEPSSDALRDFPDTLVGTIETLEKKKEKKNPPLLFNLAELQNLCSKLFKISPDETLRIVQDLYEKKLVTYPRTDARVLSSAVSKEIGKNLNGLLRYSLVSNYISEILNRGSYHGLDKTRYVNDKQITDHYAIIPTGQGHSELTRLSVTANKVYEVIVRRFLSIFFPVAVYQKINLVTKIPYFDKRERFERFFTTAKVLIEEGFLKVSAYSFVKGNKSAEEQEGVQDGDYMKKLLGLKKGDQLKVKVIEIKEGETSPPKRYNSGSIILAMESAGQLIEDEELRTQIKGSGIGTSATRAEILNKLIHITYLNLNKKTQMITPTLQGELVYEVVNASIRAMLNPDLTASWEKGLNYVQEGKISEEEYMRKLEIFINQKVAGVKNHNYRQALQKKFEQIESYYNK